MSQPDEIRKFVLDSYILVYSPPIVWAKRLIKLNTRQRNQADKKKAVWSNSTSRWSCPWSSRRVFRM